MKLLHDLRYFGHMLFSFIGLHLIHIQEYDTYNELGSCMHKIILEQLTNINFVNSSHSLQYFLVIN